MTVFEFATTLLFGLGSLVVMAYYVTHLAESGINDDAKLKVSNIVKNIKATPTIRHSFVTYTMLSDYMFGDNLISVRAFFSSCFISMSWIFIILTVCTLFFPAYTSWIDQANLSRVILNNAIPVLISVLIIDFFSVSLTRYFIREFKARGFFGLSSVLIIDLLASAILFYVGITAFKYLWINPSWLSIGASFPYFMQLDQLPIALQAVDALTSDMLVENGTGSYDIKGGWTTEVVYAFPEGVAFYSSLLTSVWLWLHIFSYFCFKAAIQIDTFKSALLKIVKIEDKPFTALAIVIVVMYIPISIIIIFVYAVFQLI